MSETATRPHVPATVAGSEWWKSAVIYQVYPRSFADSNADGVGDLTGIIEHLDHFVALGVDAVWLSPIYASPGDDAGYDISDYRSIDPLFGTLDDFDRLVTEVHARGLRIIMDLVVNHTSDEHPWFIESRSSTTSPKRDWYWWQPPRDGRVGGAEGAEPTNWESFFSGSTWEFDTNSQQYYLHLFSRKQPDLNWENPEVREAIYDMMRWWLDRGIDGFRMDVINLISKVTPLRDGTVTEGKRFGDGFPLVNCGPRIHEFLAEMNREVFSGREASLVTVGEMPGVTVDEARLFTDADNHELNMVFQFEHVDLDHGPLGKWDHRPLDLRELKSSFQRWQEGLADVGWNSLYWNNHDQPRAVSRFGNDGQFRAESAKLLAAVLHMQRGTPYIFQGEELGMSNVPFEHVSELRDIESLNYFSEATQVHGATAESVMPHIRRVGRDNARTPMQWSADQNSGFSTSAPWIRTHSNYQQVNARAQVGVPGSVFEFYRELIRLRHTARVVVDGDFRMMLPDHESLFAFERRLGAERLLVVANFSDEPTSVPAIDDLSAGLATPLVLGNYPRANAVQELRPWEVIIHGTIET
jgi:oligo-1,6-glucosidase